MAYAIFYNHQDLTSIAANVQATLASNYDQYLTTQERNSTKQTFQRAWNGGLNGWSTAPLAGNKDPNYDPNNPSATADSLIIVVSGQQVLKADLVSALRTIGTKVPNAGYMNSIADDVQNTAVEPWP